MTFFKMQEGSLRGFARPQALTCQGRRRSAAAAHAKDPARPVMQSAFRAQGLWRKDPQIFKFLAYIATFFKTRVAPPEATPSPFGTATLRLAPSALAPLGLRSSAKRAPRRATKFPLAIFPLAINKTRFTVIAYEVVSKAFFLFIAYFVSYQCM